MKKYRFLIAVFVLFFVIPLSAYPPYKRNLDLISNDKDVKCSTADYYDTNTAVTFFGDSRADLVDWFPYGASSLDTYFTTGGTWNLQNFGVKGMDSYAFKDQIQTCFKRNPTKPYYPALYITRVPQSRDNIIFVKYKLQK